MFGRFFAALNALITNTEALGASFAEANERFRQNLALDYKPQEETPPALPDRTPGGDKKRKKSVA